MENCLVKMLKGVVNDDSLHRLGELVIDYNYDGNYYKLQVAGEDSIEVSEGLTYSGKSGDYLLLSGTGKVHVFGYNLTKLCLIPDTKCSFEELKYRNNISTFQIKDGQVEGMSDISELNVFDGLNTLIIETDYLSGDFIDILEKFKNTLTTLRITKNITVRLEDVGKIKLLTALELNGTNKISGAIEDIVVSELANSRTNGTIAFPGVGSMFYYNSNVRFKGSNSTLQGVTGNKPLVWAPKQSDPSITEVSINDINVTFDGSVWKDENGNVYTP